MHECLFFTNIMSRCKIDRNQEQFLIGAQKIIMIVIFLDKNGVQHCYLVSNHLKWKTVCLRLRA